MNAKRDLHYQSELEIIDDVERLRAAGATSTGRWTLPQACWHLVFPLEHCLRQPPSLEPTEAERASAATLEPVLAAHGMPDNLPIFPGTEPPTPAPDDTVDRLLAGLRQLAAYQNSHVDFGPFGPVTIEKFREFIFIHLAHHLARFHLPAIQRRTSPRYADFDAMIADIARLRRGCTMGGNWSLPQICWHLNLGFATPLVAEASQTELTEAQIARQKRWDYYIAEGHAPPGFEAPGEMLPPTTCSDADIDALIQRLHDLTKFEGKFIRAAAGVMPIERARGFLLAHGWLHLSCLHPTHRKREHLSFASLAGIASDVKRLRRGYVAAGKWSLEQICWHLATTIPFPPEPADPNAPLTPEQTQRQTLLDTLIRIGPPAGFEAPAQIVPPETCEAAAIDDYLRRLDALAAFDAPGIHMGSFGPVATAKCKQFSLGHAARHLAYLRPIHGPRENLKFENEDAAVADIRKLRVGYTKVGTWSLPQVCWHLNITMQARMKPGTSPPNTPEQEARKPMFERVLASGQLPRGIEAPMPVTPPADAGDEAIDACIASLIAFKTHTGFAPHRLFGQMADDITHRQNLIHSAHHLSHLVPAPLSPTKQ